MIKLPFVFSRLPERKRKTRNFEVQVLLEMVQFILLPMLSIFAFGYIITSSVNQTARTQWCMDTYGTNFSYGEKDGNGICAIIDEKNGREAKASEVREYKGDR